MTHRKGEKGAPQLRIPGSWCVPVPSSATHRAQTIELLCTKRAPKVCQVLSNQHQLVARGHGHRHRHDHRYDLGYDHHNSHWHGNGHENIHEHVRRRMLSWASAAPSSLGNLRLASLRLPYGRLPPHCEHSVGVAPRSLPVVVVWWCPLLLSPLPSPPSSPPRVGAGAPKEATEGGGGRGGGRIPHGGGGR